MAKRPRIYVSLSSSDFDRYTYEGISQYVEENALEIDLEIRLDHANLLPDGKGLITRLLNKKDVQIVRAYNFPIVNISSRLEATEVPSVILDIELAGRLAAEHLLARRFHHFAFYGEHMGRHSLSQSHGFEQVVKEAEFPCELHLHHWKATTFDLTSTENQKIRKWLKSLPRPVGIFCGSDRAAWEISKAAEALGFAVGRDVGIVGFGNNDFLCNISHPKLTSVGIQPIQHAYEAMALLMRLIRGEPAPSAPILIPPSIFSRGSSDFFITSDSYVTNAIQFIQAHITEVPPIQAVFDHIPLSRDALERRFRKHLGYTVMETIHFLKIDRIKHLLVSTSKTMEEIALATGLSGGTYMGVMFRGKMGMTPSQYRHRFQRHSPSLSS
ncbi:MAG: substrate-binding domain-containing protein [Chthoniobacterales bacterium]